MDPASKDFDKPVILSGGLAVDDRGEVGFVNEFSFNDVKRFYTVLESSCWFHPCVAWPPEGGQVCDRGRWVGSCRCGQN